jgi:hypothetical protein
MDNYERNFGARPLGKPTFYNLTSSATRLMSSAPGRRSGSLYSSRRANRESATRKLRPLSTQLVQEQDLKP